MLQDFFYEKIKQNLLFEPNNEQETALLEICNFLFSRNPESLFLLKGFAGTGKSSITGALVKTMTMFKQKTVLLAPTGRAAKVFSKYADHKSFTIHKKIYRQKRFSNEPSGFIPVENLHKDTVFIVDEASMISNDGLDSFIFGSGKLLDDLIQYVYSGENCRLILIGDTAQLPPVMQEKSVALQRNVLEGFGLTVYESMLSRIVRQAENSGILYNATVIRNAIENEDTEKFPVLNIGGFTDIVHVQGEELIDEITAAYDKDGMDETIVISRSNKRSAIYNNGIRNRILWREEEISTGDILMVAKNNYYWTEKDEKIDFLANGELLEVVRIRKITEIYGFRFCDMLVRHADYETELEIKILLDTLHTETAALSKEMSERLFYTILEDYADVPGKAGKMKKMKNDPFHNAVQVKYGYAITCHKAQGGEWKNVFLDIGYITEEHLGTGFYRWLYTAFTRASNKLYLINLPKSFIGG